MAEGEELGNGSVDDDSCEDEETTEEHTAVIVQFQELTGIEDLDKCKKILEKHHWDLELAVHDTFNEREGVTGMFNEPAPSELRRRVVPDTPPEVDTDTFQQRVYHVRPLEQQQMGWMTWGARVFLLPFRFMFNTLFDLINFLLRIIRPQLDPRWMVTDPIADVENFISNFDETYGRDHPTFYHGTYSQAINEAKQELKFLLVYLHGDDHQDTSYFCTNTLCNEQVVNFINTNTLFWACNVNSPEGYRVSQALRENTFPFLAVIVLKENIMSVVARIEGPMDARSFIAALTRVKDDNGMYLVAAQTERTERHLNRSLREEQDHAYRESERQDREKEMKKQEAVEKQRLEKEVLLRAEQEAIEKEQEYLRLKEQWSSELPEEPSSSEPDCVRVVVKLPSNERLNRLFRKSHSLKYLYYFVVCSKGSPRNFDIVTNLPRRSLPCKPTDEFEPPTFKEAGLGKSEMLFVHDLDA